jgi:hypothetical protein
VKQAYPTETTHVISLDGNTVDRVVTQGWQLSATLINRCNLQRFGIYWCPEGESARRVMDGQLIPGPWAVAFPITEPDEFQLNVCPTAFEWGDYLSLADCNYRIEAGLHTGYSRCENPDTSKCHLEWAGLTAPPEPPRPDPTGLLADNLTDREDILGKTINGMATSEDKMVLSFTDDRFIIFEVRPADYDDPYPYMTTVEVKPYEHRLMLKAAGIVKADKMTEIVEAESARKQQLSENQERRELARLQKKYPKVDHGNSWERGDV